MFVQDLWLGRVCPQMCIYMQVHDGFVSVSKSPLMWIVMLVLAGSISRTLCPTSLKLRRVSVSEAAGVWIITPNAFTVHACGQRTCSLLFIVSSLPCLQSNVHFFSTVFSFCLVCLCPPRSFAYSPSFTCPLSLCICEPLPSTHLLGTLHSNL